jgi:hypothetical protein
MPWSIPVLASLVVGALSVQSPPFPKHYTSPQECGFEFDYPGDWVIASTGGETSCRVQLRPRDFADRMKARDVDVYTLDVGLERGKFLAVAANSSFDFFRGEWVTLGRLGMRTGAEVVTTDRWHGLRGVAVVSCFHEAGGNAGLCEEPVLLLRDDDENVWSMRGGPQSGDVFDVILATFRFVDP